MKKETGLGLSTKKSEDFGEWYSEVRCNSFIHLLQLVLVDHTGSPASAGLIVHHFQWSLGDRSLTGCTLAGTAFRRTFSNDSSKDEL
jgi:hypothetical protein